MRCKVISETRREMSWETERERYLDKRRREKDI